MASERGTDYLVPIGRIEGAIREIRGERVMLDVDLAAVYGVTTKALVQAVKRNLNRFPAGFVFQLTPEESSNLRSRIVTSSWGGRRYPPYAFTEHGAVMLAAVLKSKRAVEVSVFVVKAFIHMRRMLADQRQFALKLAELEGELVSHDKQIQAILQGNQPTHQPG